MWWVDEGESGFSVIEGLIAVVLIGALAVSGWAVYQQHGTNRTTDATLRGQAAAQQTTVRGTQRTLKIPELGIQITVPAAIADLTYQSTTTTVNTGIQETAATFSTVGLRAADAECDTSAGPLGALTRAAGQYPASGKDPWVAVEYGQLVKQFPTFFIAFVQPQAPCSTSPTVEATIATDKQAFTEALPTIQALEPATTN